MSGTTASMNDAPTGADLAAEISGSSASVPEAHPVEFPQAAKTRTTARLPLERFSEVSIEISVEIGRITMPIGELLQLGEGAVVELDRSVSEPVDVMAQGIRIASGEVVVIDDRFAVRITEIPSADDVGGKPSRISGKQSSGPIRPS
ncbi:MAG: flagellar motor switch protein FliN [Planctomyces sp.]|nr:flagellar motor switch protein FliN [Planctomyces sp.]